MIAQILNMINVYLCRDEKQKTRVLAYYVSQIQLHINMSFIVKIIKTKSTCHHGEKPFSTLGEVKFVEYLNKTQC